MILFDESGQLYISHLLAYVFQNMCCILYQLCEYLFPLLNTTNRCFPDHEYFKWKGVCAYRIEVKFQNKEKFKTSLYQTF